MLIRRKAKGEQVKTVHAKIVGNKAVLPREEFEWLVKLARQTEDIQLLTLEDDVPTAALMLLADECGSFEFWKEQGEEVYSMQDGEPV
jgi:hypothetical protein